MEKLISNRSYAIMALAVILVLIWYNFVYQRTANAINSGNSEIHSLQTEIAQNRELIASAGSLAGKLRDLESEMHACLDGICSVDSIPQFIQMMEQRLKKYNISRATVVPVLPDLLENENISMGHGSLNRVEFDLGGVGNYLDIGRLLEELEGEIFYADCNVIDISYKANLNPRVLFVFRFSVYLKGRA